MYSLRHFILASVMLASVYCMTTKLPEFSANAANQGLKGAESAGTSQGVTTAPKMMPHHVCQCGHPHVQSFANLKINEAVPEPKKTQELGEYEHDLAQPEEEDDLDTLAKDEDGPVDENRLHHHGEKESVDDERKSSV